MKVKPDIKGKELKREFSIGEVDTEARTVSLSFSSESEVKRYGYIEVLEHSANAVDLSRLNDSGAFLYNHNRNDYLGVIEPGSAKIESDRKGRCLARFARNDFADSKFRDVQDGILTKSSVTYRVIEYREEHKNGKDYVYVTKWQPLEVSIVTIPADASVGVGRSESPITQTQSPKMDEEEKNSAPDGGSPAGVAERSEGNNKPTGGQRSPEASKPRETGERAYREEVSQIMKMGSKFKMKDVAERAIADGMSFDEFKGKALDEFEKRTSAIKAGSENIGMSDTEARSFSFLRLLAHQSKPESRVLRERAAMEIEACQAAAEKVKHRENDKGGLMIPLDVLRTPLVQSRASDVVSIKAGAGYGGTGGNLVANTLLTSSFVELLRDRTVFLQLARSMGGLIGNIDIPKQLSGPSGYWIGEDEDALQDDITFGQLTMQPHTVATYGEITRRMLMQSSMDVEALFRMEIINGLANTINTAGFYGTGLNNQPLGILNAAGINSVDFTDDQPTFKELVEMETAVANGNAAIDSCAYVANSEFRGHAKTTLKFAGVGGTIWESGNTVNGSRTEITNSINDGDVFYGDFFEALFGMWGGLDMTVDPFTHSTKGRVRIVAMQDVDILVRRPGNFTYGVKPIA